MVIGKFEHIALGVLQKTKHPQSETSIDRWSSFKNSSDAIDDLSLFSWDAIVPCILNEGLNWAPGVESV